MYWLPRETEDSPCLEVFPRPNNSIEPQATRPEFGFEPALVGRLAHVTSRVPSILELV